MSTKKYCVQLTDDQRDHLLELTGRGSSSARKQRRARILLKTDEGEGGPAWTDVRTAEALRGCGTATVQRVRQRFSEGGLKAATSRKKPERDYQQKVDGALEAHALRLACSEAPDGRSRWTLRLLADRLVELGYVESISHETVRGVLKKTACSLTAKSNG